MGVGAPRAPWESLPGQGVPWHCQPPLSMCPPDHVASPAAGAPELPATPSISPQDRECQGAKGCFPQPPRPSQRGPQVLTWKEEREAAAAGASHGLHWRPKEQRMGRAVSPGWPAARCLEAGQDFMKRGEDSGWPRALPGTGGAAGSQQESAVKTQTQRRCTGSYTRSHARTCTRTQALATCSAHRSSASSSTIGATDKLSGPHVPGLAVSQRKEGPCGQGWMGVLHGLFLQGYLGWGDHVRNSLGLACRGRLCAPCLGMPA